MTAELLDEAGGCQGVGLGVGVGVEAVDKEVRAVAIVLHRTLHQRHVAREGHALNLLRGRRVGLEQADGGSHRQVGAVCQGDP
eukprot:CAMPEP_0202869020 /NCGR_PEP_ID=MMETSP1391-20130828/11622_1 /ASSEMBLY_ACC=CAM_ASM_000867 /TAXON_ID=1034604 /ORGANISM="Chlamydomonas leiostraca, Strain SAG 11-49" /LENGTH=82 /DNA_ID=CAMNT_0049549265 /DNA_START=84 /DNA_END=333 /DNA_ORIENTATION=-